MSLFHISRRLLLLLFCALFGVLAGLGGYTFYYAKGASYLSNDPRACVNCHIMREQYDGWQKASHHTVATCNDCHVPHDVVGKYLTKMENGFWHSKGFTFQDFPEPIRMRPQSKQIVLANCNTCHATVVSEITGHLAVGDQIDCVTCHSGVGHGPRE